jgi:Macrocin-O-methyltransferase (TylF)
VKQVHSPFAGEPHQLIGKIVFAAVWIRVVVVSWAMNWKPWAMNWRPWVMNWKPWVMLFEVRKRYVSARILWRKGIRRLIKRALVPAPPVRRYLAEKHTLEVSWMQSAAERDALAAECNHLQAQLERQHITREVVTAERDALTVERSHLEAKVELQRIALEAIAIERDTLAIERTYLQAEVERQHIARDAVTLTAGRTQLQAEVALEAVATERDALTVERIHLQAEIERQRIALEALAAERDSLFGGQQDLSRQMVSAQAEHAQDAANAILLQNNLEKIVSQFQQERAQYQDAMLGKLAIVQSQFSTLQGSLIRLAETPKATVADELSRTLYLDLLEDSLIGTIMKDESIAPWQKGYSQTSRELGRDWPKYAFTMIGKARMRNLREITETILNEGVLGDLLEAGVWRGGACIYMRGILKARGVTDRLVWVADSFAGLPPPDPEQYPADQSDVHHMVPALAVTQQEVRTNFDRYGLLDGQVCFLEGWFKDTLPKAPINQLAILRLDGDMYESTIQTLDAMYWKLSSNGFVIIDDYILPACKMAVDDFRAHHGITEKLEMVDGAAVYWRRRSSERMATKPIPKRNRRG